MYGTTKYLKQKDYLSLYESTGLDVDGRRIYISRYFPIIEMNIVNTIEWAKTVPGFLDMTQKDRLKLIKGMFCMQVRVY